MGRAVPRPIEFEIIQLGNTASALFMSAAFACRQAAARSSLKGGLIVAYLSNNAFGIAPQTSCA